MSTEVSFGSEFRNVLASTKDFNMTQEALQTQCIVQVYLT
jgi:hypothetical protein